MVRKVRCSVGAGTATASHGPAVGGRRSAVGGRWSVVGGRWSAVGGRWSVVGGAWLAHLLEVQNALFLKHHLPCEHITLELKLTQILIQTLRT